jgi:hypothetical protein
MKQITTVTNVYKFDELSDKAQENAIMNLFYINVEDDWYHYIYEEAEELGFKITGFDIDRGSHCDIKLIDSPFEICTKIMSEHGEECDTWKLAKSFIDDWNDIVAKHSDGTNIEKVAEGNEYQFDEDADFLEGQFTKELSECYLKMLRDEYEYQTSEFAIVEAIESYDYDFTEDGKLFL